MACRNPIQQSFWARRGALRRLDAAGVSLAVRRASRGAGARSGRIAIVRHCLFRGAYNDAGGDK